MTTGALTRCRAILPVEAKKKPIYSALFASHINYCSLVWLTTTQRNITRVCLLQKKVVRNIATIDYFASTEYYFKLYNIMKIQNMYEFRVFRIFYASSPTFKSFIITIALPQQYTNVRTCCPDLWVIPHFLTFYKLQSLKYNLPLMLNKYKDIAKPTLALLRQLFF